MANFPSPSYPIHFHRDDLDGAMACLDAHGYCVLRGMIGPDLVEELKAAIDAALDPQRDLPLASNRYHMAFAEASLAVWKLVEHPPFMRYMHRVLGTEDLCWHRSAAILRTPGEPMGGWHTDHRDMIPIPRDANDILNRYPLPSGSWFYLNGSHPDRSGIAVIEDSHRPGWAGPAGFELTPDRNTFHPLGAAPTAGYSAMDVPGCIPVTADPGDLICFAALTYHANMATHERRYSCGLGFRPQSIRIAAPWPLPKSARRMIAALPPHLQRYTAGYTGYDGAWRAPVEAQ